jgi:uncharacterized UBP type Zn finger protein
MLQTGLPVSRCLQRLKTLALDASAPLLNPTELFRMNIMSGWDPKLQQDAHDFFTHLTHSLHVEEYNQHGIELTAVRTTVFGQLAHHIQCNTCAHSQIEFEDFNYLTCPLQPNSINDITIEMTDISPRSCGACNTSPVLSSTEIAQAPPVLFILLGRFDDAYRKIHAEVDLQQQLVTKSNRLYELTAVIQHEGPTSVTGHYTTLLKHPQNQQWFMCNDLLVSPHKLPRYSAYAYIVVYVLMT